MNSEEYQELRNKINDDIKNLWLNTTALDKYCYGCIDYEHVPVRGAGAPERQPYTRCGMLGMSWECSGDRRKVYRIMECILGNYKTTK
jgi:hypothetical protein